MTSSLPHQFSSPAAASPSAGQKYPGLADKRSSAELGLAGYAAHRPVKFETLMPAEAGSPRRVAPRASRQTAQTSEQHRSSSARTANQNVDQWAQEEAAAAADDSDPSVIKPEQREQAAAFVAAIMQIMQPADPVVTSGRSVSSPNMGQADTLSPGQGMDVSSQGAEPANGLTVGTPGAGDPLSSAVAANAKNPPMPEFTIAGDGAIECVLPSQPDNATDRSGDPAATNRLEVQAELAIPGQPIVRVGLGGSGRVAKAAQGGAEKIAEDHLAKRQGVLNGENDSERKILNVGAKGDAIAGTEAGIGIAQRDAAMSTASHEVISSFRPSGTVADGTAQLGIAGEPRVTGQGTAAPAEQVADNFAERAVATVTGLAEAQFSVSMQKTGRVQLKLKFGGEDLNVRIELRDGVVHTDFQSDSPELRAAIMREWQSVAAAAPGRLQKFLDPVFSPGSSSPAADAGAQGQSFHRPQQQANEQAATRPDGWSTPANFSRRSVLSESFLPEPAVSRVALQLPTSLRLSALA